MNIKILFFSALLVVIAASCTDAEDANNQFVIERDALAAELNVAQKENKILTEALNNIRREQESLRVLLQTSLSLLPQKSVIPGGGADSVGAPQALVMADDDSWSPPSQTSSGGGGQLYQVRPGDVLSTIAMRHGTSIRTLVELNPWLSQRNNYMLRETDQIQLP